MRSASKSAIASMLCAALTACASERDEPVGTDAGDAGRAPARADDASAGRDRAPWTSGAPLPAVEQDVGDPVLGEQLLLEGNYMSCGVPWRLWTDPAFGPLLAGALGGADGEPLPGREGKNAELPYSTTAFVAADGEEVVNANCLTCHAGRFDGERVIGLPNATVDFTAGLGGGMPAPPDALLEGLGLRDTELAHMRKVLRTARVLGPLTNMRTVGQNPAEQLTGALLAHHDRDTLAWSEQPLLEIPPVRDDAGAPIPDARLTSEPPPWWRAHKKNALFYNAMARGQHRGTMALATAVCVDTLQEAERVDALFLHMHAYVLSLRAPVYRRAVDDALAAEGKRVFGESCAGCHGTYADDPTDDDADTYPNLLIPLEVIGTDDAVARAPLDNRAVLDHYNGSFYGSVAPSVPDDPFVGYVAPPLDGIWATAPFLHNGSVPSVELVLDSAARPERWKRVDLDDTHFDEDALGWPYEVVDRPQAEASEAERKLIYDTAYYSQGNGGHTFGDHLTRAERRAVIEYLKTL